MPRSQAPSLENESTMVTNAAPPLATIPVPPPIGVEMADDDDEPATLIGESPAASMPLPTPPISVNVAPAELSRPSLSSLIDDDLSTSDSYSDDLSEEAPDSLVGTILGDRYVVDRVLGEGGMGKVYRAHHKVIDKKVAIKILHAELAKDKESVGRFLREARAASSIGNPHIVDIIDFGEAEDGSTYFVMEFLNGQSLGDTLAELGKISAKTTVDLAIQICDGLAAAHAEGIVHRDLKPDNVVLVKPKGTWAGQGHFVKILDFGIAKVSGPTGNTSKLTMAGAVFGTPHYMSPEQASGEAVDHRTDIYSLGVMMYEMISGEMPFKAENFMGILTQHMYKPPPSLRARPEGLDCPEALEAIVMKCMAKRADARYQTMEELAADLLSFKQTGSAKASSETGVGTTTDVASAVVAPSQPIPSSVGAGGSKRLGVILGSAAVLLGIVGAVVALRPKSEAKADAVATAATALPATTATATPTTAATATPTAAPSAAAAEKTVLLYSDVADAHALLGDRKAKLPEQIKLTDGKPLKVRVEAGPLYEATEVTVDGSSPKVKVDLKKKAGAVGVAGRPLPIPPTTGSGGKSPIRRGNPDGVVDPW